MSKVTRRCGQFAGHDAGITESDGVEGGVRSLALVARGAETNAADSSEMWGEAIMPGRYGLAQGIQAGVWCATDNCLSVTGGFARLWVAPLTDVCQWEEGTEAQRQQARGQGGAKGLRGGGRGGTASDAGSGRVLVSIGGCDPGVGWVAVEPVGGGELVEDPLKEAPR